MSLSDFANRLKLLRNEAGLSQEEFAGKINSSRGSISFYEKDERKPDVEIILTICKSFKVSSDWLLGLSDIKEHNVEKQAVGAYLGLCDQAIDNLRMVTRPIPEEYKGLLGSEGEKRAKDVLNAFLSNDKFPHVFFRSGYFIETYLNSKKISKEELRSVRDKFRKEIGPSLSIVPKDSLSAEGIRRESEILSSIFSEYFREIQLLNYEPYFHQDEEYTPSEEEMKELYEHLSE